MPQDNRENDKIILDRLEKIQDDVTKTKIDMALNTKSTLDIEDHLKTLNGKVLTNQNSIAAVQAQATLAATFITESKEAEKKAQQKLEQKLDGKSQNYNKVYWLILGIGLTLLGRIITYAEQADFFKHIIK